MIDLAVLGAMGQAMHEALVLAAFAAGALVLLVIVLAVAARRTPPDWQPRHLDEALHGPPSLRDQALLEAIERGDLQGPDDQGSDE